MNPKDQYVNNQFTRSNSPGFGSFGNYVNRTSPEYVDRFKKAVASNETSVVKDKYGFSQPSGVKAQGAAMGKYQTTEGELATYAKRFLPGTFVTSQQFNTNPNLQEQYMTNKAKYYLNLGYTPQNVADIHNGGFTKSGNPGYTNYMKPDYVSKFMAQYKLKAPPAPGIASAPPARR